MPQVKVPKPEKQVTWEHVVDLDRRITRLEGREKGSFLWQRAFKKDIHGRVVKGNTVLFVLYAITLAVSFAALYIANQ